MSDDRAKHGNGQRLARPQREGHRPQAKALHGNPQCRKRHFAGYQSYNTGVARLFCLRAKFLQ